MKNMYVNTRVRTCQCTAVWLRPALCHVEGNASWSSFIHKAGHKLPYHRGVRAALSLCMIPLPSCSLTGFLPLTLHFGTVCSSGVEASILSDPCAGKKNRKKDR